MVALLHFSVTGLEVDYIHNKQRKKDEDEVKIAQRSMRKRGRLLEGACDKSEVACRRMFEDRVKFNRNLNR